MAPYERRKRSTCRTKRSPDLSASVTVKKKVPPLILARRYRDMREHRSFLTRGHGAAHVIGQRFAPGRWRLCPPTELRPRATCIRDVGTALCAFAHPTELNVFSPADTNGQ